MKSKKLFLLSLVVVLFGVLISEITLSQDTDPNRDYPLYIRPTLAPSIFSPGAVVTLNDYDNWHIGTDFAEVEMSGNPINPTNFAAAWNNLNASYGAYSYYTLNGIDWLASTQPTWGASANGDPVMSFDGSGNLYFDNMYGTTPSGLSVINTKVAKSTNGGQSYSGYAFASTGYDKTGLLLFKQAVLMQITFINV